MADTTTKTYAIHPAIGVTRMGNAELDISDSSTYFIGAESPYQVANDGQLYKKNGKIKKQAQRFRIFEFENGVAVREITIDQDDVESITWQIHLANCKAALDITDKTPGSISSPTYRPVDFHPSATRNASVPSSERGDLCIDTSQNTISSGEGIKVLSGDFSAGSDKSAEKTNIKVKLASISCEQISGRLLVFASDGLSQGLLGDKFSEQAELGANGGDFANNNNWYDQTGDGPVHATIVFTDGTSIVLDQPEQSAWILCSLPKYTPAFNYFTNLEHVALSAAYQSGHVIPRPVFSRDIYPILRSVSLLQWVSARGSLGHGTHGQGYYLSRDRLRFLSDNNSAPGSDSYKARHGIFKRIRNPETLPVRPSLNLTLAAVEPKQMPQIPGDVMNNQKGHDWALPSVTPLQYKILEKWRDGDFDSDPDGVYDFVPLNQIPVAEQPAALDRAALEGTCGTPFYPGIEAWSVMALSDLYAAPMRLKPDVKPGDLTMGNALPWQADYLDCNDGWWPVQRPNQVTRDGKIQQPWAPDEWIDEDGNDLYVKMVEDWWRLGFIISTDNNASFEESERNLDEPIK